MARKPRQTRRRRRRRRRGEVLERFWVGWNGWRRWEGGHRPTAKKSVPSAEPGGLRKVGTNKKCLTLGTREITQQSETSPVRLHESFKNNSSKTESDDSTAYSARCKNKTDKVDEPYPRANIVNIPLPLRNAQQVRATKNRKILRRHGRAGGNSMPPLPQRHRSQQPLGHQVRHQMGGGLCHRGVGLSRSQCDSEQAVSPDGW